MDIEIKVTEEEKQKVIQAIKDIGALPHVKYMSQAMIAEQSCIKATKVRAILIELIAEKRITQYAATENKAKQRYYYVVEPPISFKQAIKKLQVPQ